MEKNEITKTAETTPQTRAAMLNSRIIANAKIAAESLVMVGRDLKAMRDEKLYTELGCDTFEEYCNEMTPIKQRQAYNFIKCYEKYGERLTELSDIGITKLTLMSALDDEDSDALIESGAAEGLSVRELEQRVKELQSKCEQLTLDLGEKSKEETKLDKMRAEMEKLQAELTAQKDIQAKKDERIKALESKPIEVAVEKPTKDEIAEIEKKAVEKAKKAAQKQHEKELAALREKAENERREAVEAAERAKSVEIERLKKENAALQSSAKKAPPTSEKERIKLCLEEVQRNFNLALETLDKLPDDDRENIKGKLRAFVEIMGGLLK